MASRLSYQLPARAKDILVNLSYALITEPADLVLAARDGELIMRAEALIREMPKLLRLGLIFGIYFFDRLTFLFGFGLGRFVRLGREGQRLYALRWLNSRVSLFHDIMTGLRGLLMICYFSHHDVWRYIGYDPATHARERVALRQSLLTKQK